MRLEDALIIVLELAKHYALDEEQREACDVVERHLGHSDELVDEE